MDSSQPPNRSLPGHSIVWKSIIVVIGVLLILFTPIPFTSSESTDRHIRIEASMFQFTPGEIRINTGDRVTIELASTDVVHGLSLDGYNFEIKADPGQTISKSFVADKSGTFRFRCSVVCGNLHPFMIGKIQVGSNLLFIRGVALGILAIIAGIWTAMDKNKFGKNQTL